MKNYTHIINHAYARMYNMWQRTARPRTAVLLAATAMAATAAHAQVETKPLEAGRSAEGAVYFLPKTELRIHLLVEKKTFKPGEFAKYAEKYLHLQGVEQERQTTFSVVDYSITQIGVRDTSKCFAVKLKGGKCETAELKFSDDGVLLAVNAEPAAYVGRAPFRAFPKPAAVSPRRFMTAEARGASSAAKMAELTAQQLLELQESRQQLITGDADETPQDEQQLVTMLSEIDRESSALMSLFTGEVTRDTTEHIITICPDEEIDHKVLFRLSQKLGVVDSDDLSGVPFYMSVENLHPASHPAAENKKNDGFFVNVPGMARITLYQQNMQLASFDVPLAQFGFVTLRDGAIFKRYVTRMRLNPATGAVDMLSAEQ